MLSKRCTATVVCMCTLPAVLLLSAQDGIPDRMAEAEHELRAVVEWEMLWDSSPSGFKVSADSQKPVSCALLLNRESVSYCSRDLGVCVKYAVSGLRNWQAVNSVPCCNGSSEERALEKFAGIERGAVGRMSRTGSFGPSGLTWVASIELSSRNEIIAGYKRIRPTDIESLRDSLKKRLSAAGYESITIPCYKATDPVVYVFGTRGDRGATVFANILDKESGTWIDAGIVTPRGNRGELERVEALVKALSCSTLEFPH